MDVFFAERVGAMLAGVPNSADAERTADLRPHRPDERQRQAGTSATTTTSLRAWDSLTARRTTACCRKILGKGRCLRAGAGIVYDRFGSDLVTEFDRTGSPGLATNVTQPVNTDFTTASALSATACRRCLTARRRSVSRSRRRRSSADSAAASASIHDWLRRTRSCSTQVYAREVKGGITVEVGYVGRLSRKNLLQVDAMPAADAVR